MGYRSKMRENILKINDNNDKRKRGISDTLTAIKLTSMGMRAIGNLRKSKDGLFTKDTSGDFNWTWNKK